MSSGDSWLLGNKYFLMKPVFPYPWILQIHHRDFQDQFKVWELLPLFGTTAPKVVLVLVLVPVNMSLQWAEETLHEGLRVGS